MRDVELGKLSLREAARLLGVSYQLTWHHYTYHRGAEISASDETFKVLERIKAVLLHCLEQLDNRYDRQTILSITRVVEQLRKTVLDIERISGRLRSGTLIIQQVNVFYEKLMAILTTELCEDCRRRILSRLERLKKREAI